MRLAILVLITISASIVKAQDFDSEIKSLLKKREKAIADIDKSFKDEFLAVRKASIEKLQVDFEASMKALDLEGSNRIKAQIEQLKVLEPKFNQRDLFIVDRSSKDEHLRFFIRCTEGVWLEYGQVKGNTVAVCFKELSATKDFVEIVHENGFVHRLYDVKTMYKNSEMTTFKLGFKGRWLAEVEIDFPTDRLPVK